VIGCVETDTVSGVIEGELTVRDVIAGLRVKLMLPDEGPGETVPEKLT